MERYLSIISVYNLSSFWVKPEGQMPDGFRKINTAKKQIRIYGKHARSHAHANNDVDTFSHLWTCAIYQSKALNRNTSTAFISNTCDCSRCYREILRLNAKTISNDSCRRLTPQGSVTVHRWKMKSFCLLLFLFFKAKIWTTHVVERKFGVMISKNNDKLIS